MNSLDTSVLRARYVECFGARASMGETLRETVKDLVERGVSRRTLIAWAVETGCSQGYVSKLLSQVFCALGMRERRAGAGRKPSPEVLQLLAYAQAEFGERHLKVLRAAWRIGKAQAPREIAIGRATIFSQPVSGRMEANYGSVIRNTANHRTAVA